MSSRLRKTSPYPDSSNTSESKNSSRPAPRVSLAKSAIPKPRPISTLTTDLTTSLTVLELKRRSMYDTLTTSADLLDSTRRQARRSLVQNLKNGVGKLRPGKEKEEDSADDKSFYCVGEPQAARVERREWEKQESAARRESTDSNVPWPERRTSLGWMVVGMLVRKGELRDSVVADSRCEDVYQEYEKPLPPHPEIDEDEGDYAEERVVTYRHST